MNIVDDAFKIIGNSAKEIMFLCKDNSKHSSSFFFNDHAIERYRNQLEANLTRLKEKLKETDVNEVGNRSTLLGYAAHVGWLEAVKYLVEEKGADVNQVGTSGTPPLHEAAWRQADVVEYLIKKGADVNKVDRNGDTPLHVAVSFLQFAQRPANSHELGCFRQIDILNFLIEAGADVKKNKKDMTPLDGLTDERDSPEALQLLIIPTLLNYPTLKKPNSIKKNKDLSIFWDTE